ncbi:MAG: response regulator [Actinobacteria bacterium]|nr:response regulator [Actinomycetota bacterium]MBU1493854.1 response regulator [Actinomycetota bacterium]MBU1866405.1 response regulator [Actinomycetota bacterium]
MVREPSNGRNAVAIRVLVVEDSAVIQRLIAVCLRPSGVEVETRSDGPTGLQAALDDPPDLLILDVGLPKMDGWQVLDRIRSDLRTRNLKVLVLTAHAQEETRERADRGGADAFVTKPFRPDELRRVAESLIGVPVRAGRLA